MSKFSRKTHFQRKSERNDIVRGDRGSKSSRQIPLTAGRKSRAKKNRIQECGSKYRRHNKRTKENGIEATWVCINHKINGNEACPAQYVLEKDIENAYLRALSKISEEYKDTLETIRANVHNEIDDRLYEEIDGITGQLERKQEEMLNLIKALSRKEITEAEYNEKVIIMTAEVDSLITAERLKEIDEVISGRLGTSKFDA